MKLSEYPTAADASTAAVKASRAAISAVTSATWAKGLVGGPNKCRSSVLPRGNGIQSGSRGVGRLDYRRDCIGSNELTRAHHGSFRCANHGLARGAGRASCEILGQLDGVTHCRPAPLSLGMAIARDGKLLDSAQREANATIARSGNFLKSSSVYFGMIIFASMIL